MEPSFARVRRRLRGAGTSRRVEPPRTPRSSRERHLERLHSLFRHLAQTVHFRFRRRYRLVVRAQSALRLRERELALRLGSLRLRHLPPRSFTLSIRLLEQLLRRIHRLFRRRSRRVRRPVPLGALSRLLSRARPQGPSLSERRLVLLPFRDRARVLSLGARGGGFGAIYGHHRRGVVRAGALRETRERASVVPRFSGHFTSATHRARERRAKGSRTHRARATDGEKRDVATGHVSTRRGMVRRRRLTRSGLITR